MDFVAIDVETANADLSSICQVGVACFQQGIVMEEWSSLVDPEDYFDGWNISIHGITEQMVRGQPTLPRIAARIHGFLEASVAVCHTHFDRTAISLAFEKYDLTVPTPYWLDSARVARRSWSEVAWRGYGLSNLCKRLGYEYRPHDALEDAKAAGHVLLAAIQDTGIDLDGWRHRVRQPIDLSKVRADQPISREGNPEGDLYGEVVVFTGALKLPRREAADLAASIGCRVAAGVTHETTILVVGNQDLARLVGHQKSGKHRKAEKLVSEGQAIRILRESDFERLVRDHV